MALGRTNMPLALAMAHCPNCAYAIDQIGERTHCAKCGRQLTILCINCQTNNPPIFQSCMKCGVDYRAFGLEHYRLALRKVAAGLAQYQETKLRYQQTLKIVQYFRAAILIVCLIVGWYCWSLSPRLITLSLPLDLLFILYILNRLYGQRCAAWLAKIPLEFVVYWQQITLAAEKQQDLHEKLQKQLDYYQREEDRFHGYK